MKNPKIILFLLPSFLICTLAFAENSEKKGFKWNKVKCSFETALEIAEKAALDKYPEQKDVILNDKNSGFAERHGGNEPETIIREYSLEYKQIDKVKEKGQYTHETENGKIFYYDNSFYKDSIIVVLNNDCAVVYVNREKGKYYSVE